MKDVKTAEKLKFLVSKRKKIGTNTIKFSNNERNKIRKRLKMT